MAKKKINNDRFRFIVIGIVIGFSLLLGLLISGHMVLASNSTASNNKCMGCTDNVELFIFVLLLSFAIGAIILGAFTTYFGSGLSKAVGGALLVGGILIFTIFVYYRYITKGSDTLFGIIHWSSVPFVQPLLVIVAFIIGLIIALVLFLVGIIKS